MGREHTHPKWNYKNTPKLSKKKKKTLSFLSNTKRGEILRGGLNNIVIDIII